MASFAFGAALTGTQDGLKFSSSLRVLGGGVVSARCMLTSAGGALWTSVCGWSSEAVLEQYPHKSRLEPRKQPWGSLRRGIANPSCRLTGPARREYYWLNKCISKKGRQQVYSVVHPGRAGEMRR